MMKGLYAHNVCGAAEVAGFVAPRAEQLRGGHAMIAA